MGGGGNWCENLIGRGGRERGGSRLLCECADEGGGIGGGRGLGESPGDEGFVGFYFKIGLYLI